MRVETEDSASGPVDPEQPASERIRPPLDARPKRGLGSWPVIIVGLALTLGGFVLTSRTAPCSDFHAGTQFSGSDERLAKWIGGCGDDLGEARATLLADGVLIAGYAIAAGGILRRWWPLYQAPRLKRRERLMVALPFITAALDVAENIATWSALGSDGESYTYPDNLFAPTLVSTLAWLKMLAYGAGLLSVAAVCLLAFARRNESARPIPRPDHRSSCESYRHRPTWGSAARVEESAPPPSPWERSTNSNGPGSCRGLAGSPPYRAATMPRRRGRWPESTTGRATPRPT